MPSFVMHSWHRCLWVLYCTVLYTHEARYNAIMTIRTAYMVISLYVCTYCVMCFLPVFFPSHVAHSGSRRRGARSVHGRLLGACMYVHTFCVTCLRTATYSTMPNDVLRRCCTYLPSYNRAYRLPGLVFVL
ncbi:hypothetical protein GGR54DRAFT_623111, partial [Hypoxylon sp. NC1633]